MRENAEHALMLLLRAGLWERPIDGDGMGGGARDGEEADRCGDCGQRTGISSGNTPSAGWPNGPLGFGGRWSGTA